MENNCYYPIMKWKKGEKIALQNLQDIQQHFTPVIELIEDCKPEIFFDDLRSYFGYPIYFDTTRCDDENRSLLIEFTEYCSENQLEAWPLLYVSDLDNTLSYITELTSKFAMKLPIPEDFEGPSNKEIINALLVYSEDKQIDLFLDAGVVVDSRRANEAYAHYKSIISEFMDELNTFNKVIICLTSFPEIITVDSGDSCQYSRYDIKIFKKLLEIFSDPIRSKFAYSDYGVTKFTETELDFRLIRNAILPKVKYTAEDFYFVSKGKKDRRMGIYTVSYNDIAKDIINLPFYSGKDFSFGDKSIYEKATQSPATPGNSTQWVSFCANHHIALLVEQLSNLLCSLEHFSHTH